MNPTSQILTIAGVLLGALFTFAANFAMDKARFRRTQLTRWDERRLDTYANYLELVRAQMFASILYFEQRTGIREVNRTAEELFQDIVSSETKRGAAFERVLLLASEDVIAAAMELNKAVANIEWRARGLTEGDMTGWRSLHRTAFAAINAFHLAARFDLGVSRSRDTTDLPSDPNVLLPSD